MSGIVKGIGKAVKGIVKGVGHFIKRYWKVIVIAAAIVFTAGIATVGVAGFASMSAAAGGGFGGFMTAVGGTFAAGAGTLTAGIIGGTPASAGLGASTAGGGLLSTSTAYTGTGAIAAPGAASAGIVPTSAEVSSFYGGGAAAAADTGTAAAVQAAAAPAAQTGTSVLEGGTYTGPDAISSTGGGFGGGAGSSLVAPPTPPTPPVASKGLLGTIMDSKATGPLIQSGVGLLKGYAQGQAEQDYLNQTKPLGFFGVGVRGNAPDAQVNSVFGANEALTGGMVNPAGGLSAANGNPFSSVNAQGQPTQAVQQISPYVPDARANLPNGTQWMPNLPNASQGLMTIGWNSKTGKPIYANNPTQAYQGG